MSSSLDEGRPEAQHFYFQWHVTERCNRSCRHCYQDGHPSAELPLDDLVKILLRMDEALVKWELPGSLSLTGGEPFVRENDLFALMERIDEISSIAFYDILSNGSFLSEGTVGKLRNCRKLRRVQLSLEGAKNETNDAIRGDGAFDETLRAIRALKKGGLMVSVMTTISRMNWQEIPALIEMLEDEGVDTFAMERLIPEGNGAGLWDQVLRPDELKKLYELTYDLACHKRRLRILLYRPLFALVAPEDSTVGALCSVGNNALAIMPDGTVYPCRRLPIPIGNALRDGFFSIWYGSEVLWRARNPANLGGKCRDCDLLTSCRGCRAMAYFATGDYMAEEPQCWR